MSAHTPGPWGSAPLGMGNLVGAVTPDGIGNIAVVYGAIANQRREADLALIVAAPDLLAALEKADQALRHAHLLLKTHARTVLMTPIDEALQFSGAAIAKARGGA